VVGILKLSFRGINCEWNKKLISKFLVENVLLHGAHTCALNTEHANKLLAAETGVWRRTSRNSSEGNFQYCTVRATVNVGKSILLVEVIDEKKFP